MLGGYTIGMHHYGGFVGHGGGCCSVGVDVSVVGAVADADGVVVAVAVGDEVVVVGAAVGCGDRMHPICDQVVLIVS